MGQALREDFCIGHDPQDIGTHKPDHFCVTEALPDQSRDELRVTGHVVQAIHQRRIAIKISADS